MWSRISAQSCWRSSWVQLHCLVLWILGLIICCPDGARVRSSFCEPKPSCLVPRRGKQSVCGEGPRPLHDPHGLPVFQSIAVANPDFATDPVIESQTYHSILWCGITHIRYQLIIQPINIQPPLHFQGQGALMSFSPPNPVASEPCAEGSQKEPLWTWARYIYIYTLSLDACIYVYLFHRMGQVNNIIASI